MKERGERIHKAILIIINLIRFNSNV